MFGYVTINKPELKVKDYQRYHAYYCGLCNMLKKRHGILGQMTLTYDMTFLVILLTSLYESKTTHKASHCLMHPIKKHDMLQNKITEYAADMNIVLAYHHFLDDWQDEKRMDGLAGAKLLQTKYKKIYIQYPRQCKVIATYLNKLLQYEEANETNLDNVAGCFGQLMAELFVYEKDAWESNLRHIGFFLGKFIYLMDAYFDLEEDQKNKSFNPLIPLSHRKDYEETCRQMLTMMVSEATREFETLPCLLDVDILRNILYGGVWVKYDNKRKETKK